MAGHRSGIRAAYVPDSTTGTLWFADRAVWVADGDRLLPFVAPATAQAYIAAHAGARTVSYSDALGRSS